MNYKAKPFSKRQLKKSSQQETHKDKNILKIEGYKIMQTLLRIPG